MKVTDLGQLKKCLEETKNYTGLKISTLADTAAGAIEEVAETAELNQANIEEIKSNLEMIENLLVLIEEQGKLLESINSNAARLTAARADYLDKLADLGAVNDTGGTSSAGTVMAKLNKLLTDWTTTRASYINNIYTYTSNVNTRLTAARAGYLDSLSNFGATGDTGGTSTAGTLTAKSNKLLTDWTTTRAGYIDTIYTNTARMTSTRAGYIDKLSNFGATGDTGGTSTAGTLTAKTNKLLTDWTTTRAGYIDNIKTYTTNLNSRLTAARAGYLDKLNTGVGIKSVQRGIFQETPTSQDKENDITVNLSTITPSKTFILLNGGLSAGYSGSSSAVRGYISSVSTTNFVYKTGRASMTITAGYVSWQAVEFY